LKIFGSDGFRCQFGTKFMTSIFITKFSHAIANMHIAKNYKKPVLIARDSRDSGVIIENLLSSILLANGINVVVASILPTPGMSVLLSTTEYSLGIMITASHNDHCDNGIKLFSGSGSKLASNLEAELEQSILNQRSNINNFHAGIPVGKKVYLNQAFKNYIEAVLLMTFPKNLPNKILVDCSNGAFSGLGKVLKDDLSIVCINNSPNGNNINLNCGALHPETLLEEVRAGSYDYGVALDGDGDRAIFVSNKYGLIETEKLAFLFFEMMKVNDHNIEAKLVISEISNLALQHNIESTGGTLIQTEVGDRFIIDEVKNHNAVLGCEPSGHFHFPKQSQTMDGFLAIQKFIILLDSSDGNIDDKLANLAHFERIQKNINISKYINIDLPFIRRSIELVIDQNLEKFIIRESMWDPVIRMYYDFKEQNNFLSIEQTVIDLLTQENNH